MVRKQKMANGLINCWSTNKPTQPPAPPRRLQDETVISGERLQLYDLVRLTELFDIVIAYSREIGSNGVHFIIQDGVGTNGAPKCVGDDTLRFCLTLNLVLLVPSELQALRRRPQVSIVLGRWGQASQ